MGDPTMAHRTLFPLLLALALLPACWRTSSPGGGTAPDADTDADTDADVDSDTDADTDTDTDTDSDADTDTAECGDEWVGLPCEPPGEDMPDPCWDLACTTDAFCYAFDGGQHGLCTKACTAATHEVPMQEGCPSFDGYVCTDVSGLTADPADDESGFAICLEECIPDPQGQPGPCKSEHIRCDPWSWAWESQFATCLLPKCVTDADCPVASGPTCTGDGDCLTAEGETCSEAGYCVFEADCDTASGRCSWEAGNVDAEPGDPCETAHDCGANSVCIQPGADGDGKVAPANGYCVRYGCKVDGASPALDEEFGCGMLGVCHNGFIHGGACLKRCNPPHDQSAFRCRQQSWGSEILDEDGDYDCYDGTGVLEYPIWASGNILTIPAVISPYCSWISRDAPLRVGSFLKCGSGDTELDSGQCSYFYGGWPTPWPLNMACRNAATGEIDTDGYCLDETTSGPTETW